jgi:hypothetical protein
MSFEYVQKKKIEITPDMVEVVYSGTPHTCMCGCSGTYYYHPDYTKRAEERGGKISLSMINKVIKIFNEWENKYEIIEGIDDRIFTIIFSETRQYTIYLRED